MSASSARARLLAKFRSIAAERLNRLNNTFVALEHEPDDEAAVELILREIHSLKGEAKMMGFPRVNEVAHKTEELLHHAKARRFQLPPASNDVFLRGLDIMAILLDEDSSAPEPDFTEFAAQIDRAIRATDDPSGTGEVIPGPDPTPTAACTDASETVPPPRKPRDTQASKAVPEPSVGDRGADGSAGVEGSLNHPRREEFLRVSLDRLDELTELVGDLVMSQGRDEHSLDAFADLAAFLDATLEDVRSLVDGLLGRKPGFSMDPEEAIEELGQRVTRQRELMRQLQLHIERAKDDRFEGHLRLEDLQARVRELRLLPISSLFSRYPRAIRDLAREQGKQVRVDLRGGAVEVDKQVLDLLDEPLLHLSRNSIDHGIERPDERRSQGKPPMARITISARQQGSSVEITVTDDGRGLDLEAIRSKAVQVGILDDAQSLELGERALAELVFHSGLSTARKVTDISGRGVGMNVVREKVRDLGGTVEVSTRPGHGASVRMRVPISVVLSRALLVRDGAEFYGLPSDTVAACTLVAPGDVVVAGQGKAFRLDGELVPLTDLGFLLRGTAAASTPGARFSVVVLQHQNKRLGLRVSRFVGERELVQRPLDPFLENLSILHGTAVLEGGDMVFLLNVGGLMDSAAERGTKGLQFVPDAVGVEQTILVVDDSEFTRDLLVGILRDLGYRVIEGVNGRDGLEAFRQGKPDLVLTDLDMPILDGFGFMAELRQLPEAKGVPVIVLSTRGSDEDKRRASELGASGYLVKSEFREELLARTVVRFLAEEG